MGVNYNSGSGDGDKQSEGEFDGLIGRNLATVLMRRARERNTAKISLE